jgi:hypothetical protein
MRPYLDVNACPLLHMIKLLERQRILYLAVNGDIVVEIVTVVYDYVPKPCNHLLLRT